MLHMQSHGAVAVLLTSSASASNKLSNATSYPSNIPVNTFLLAKSHKELLELAKKHPKGQFAVIAPPEPSRDLDASIVIIFLMAIFTVGAGSLWSGYTKHSLRLKKAGVDADGNISSSPRHRRNRRRSSAHGADQTLAEDALGDDDDEEGKVQQQEEELSVKVTPLLVVFFVACMCGMLVLLYFFFDKLGKF